MAVTKLFPPQSGHPESPWHSLALLSSHRRPVHRDQQRRLLLSLPQPLIGFLHALAHEAQAKSTLTPLHPPPRRGSTGLQSYLETRSCECSVSQAPPSRLPCKGVDLEGRHDASALGAADPRHTCRDPRAPLGAAPVPRLKPFTSHLLPGMLSQDLLKPLRVSSPQGYPPAATDSTIALEASVRKRSSGLPHTTRRCGKSVEDSRRLKNAACASHR